ncbi:hypothetical protein [Vibrio harveyi]|nr:hypothetical protein [Vibrio harveyi]
MRLKLLGLIAKILGIGFKVDDLPYGSRAYFKREIANKPTSNYLGDSDVQ